MHSRALGVRDLEEFPSSPKARLSFITDTRHAGTASRTPKPEEPEYLAIALVVVAVLGIAITAATEAGESLTTAFEGAIGKIFKVDGGSGETN